MSTTSEWISRQIETALSRAFDSIDKYQRDGYCTEADVTADLCNGWGDAVADAWLEYIGGDKR